MARRSPLPAPRGAQRGLGLLDSLVALALLAFGLLGMTHMQTNLLRQASESQARLTAVQLGDELLSTARVDVLNKACYTLPADGACANANARARTDEWADRVTAALPGSASATAALANDRLTVTIAWTGKAADEPRRMELTTDVRPDKN